ncbi:MAG: hypothetical protein ACFFAS_07815 [Promethearchaeota archaeon]
MNKKSKINGKKFGTKILIFSLLLFSIPITISNSRINIEETNSIEPCTSTAQSL